MFWQTSRRKISLEKTLVMGIINVTPDSFSDGGLFNSVSAALSQAGKMIADGADILDIGGESTRPNSLSINIEEEKKRVLPIIEAITKKFDVPISIDTSKSSVAEAAISAGAEIINDISGLRFDQRVADISAKSGAGLVLMHLRGTFATMHEQHQAVDILPEVREEFFRSLEIAKQKGVTDGQIVLDVGIGFSKTFEQNLELMANLDKLIDDFSNYPMLVGTSRKSLIGKILHQPDPRKRLSGSISTAAIAVFNGAKVIRAHDIRETVEAVRIAEEVRKKRL